MDTRTRCGTCEHGRSVAIGREHPSAGSRTQNHAVMDTTGCQLHLCVVSGQVWRYATGTSRPLRHRRVDVAPCEWLEDDPHLQRPAPVYPELWQSEPRPRPCAKCPWYGEYWNNTDQSGPATLVRNDASINFNWGFGSPDPARIFADNFSARWSRNVTVNGGTWRFNVQADDGIRLVVDNQPVLDFYTFVGNQTRSADVFLNPGTHNIRLDYVERTGVALVRLAFAAVSPCTGTVYPCSAPHPPPPDNGKFNNGPWLAQYYPNPSFQGNPTSRTEPSLRFDWHGNPPVAGFPGGFWTARFQQVRAFNPGVYQFVARVDDGVRITINDVQVMNEWREQSTRTFTSNVKLGAGNYNIVVEYAQFGGLSDLSLYWDFLGNPDAPKPQVQVVPIMPVVGPVPYIAPIP